MRLAALSTALCLAAAAPAAAADRPAGPVFTWGYEAYQSALPNWNPDRAPVVALRPWYRTVESVLSRSGRNGLWFTGAAALPLRVPLHPKEPKAWRTDRNLRRHYAATGLKWDVQLEIWAARIALRRRGTVVTDPNAARTAYTRRISLLDPVYRRAALREIRRLVPTYRTAPYVNAYTGTDEPVIVLPRGRAAERSSYARWMRRDVRRRFGWSPPRSGDRPSRSARAQLRQLAYSRWTGARFFALKREQARLIRRLDAGATIVPNNYGFIDGFIPWDYTRLAAFADQVEADPYVSFGERQTPGRGRYNPGFGAKFLSDLTGVPVRIVIQAFPHAGYTPRPTDLYPWTTQALRAGAEQIVFFGSDNPRVVAPRRFAAMHDIAAKLRGTRLPERPEDPTRLMLYATASEGQGQPWKAGNKRHRTSGDELYTGYALLGALGHGAFSFDSDARLLREPWRLERATTIWLPRSETLDRVMADRLLAWVRAGGTLIVTDPQAFTRTPRGRSLGDVRGALIRARLGAPRPGRMLIMAESSLGDGLPDSDLELPLMTDRPRAFADVPAGSTVVARFVDDSPAALLHRVGTGRVLAFSADLMRPEALEDPLDLVRFARTLQEWVGGELDHPAWSYTIAGAPRSSDPPWPGSWAE